MLFHKVLLPILAFLFVIAQIYHLGLLNYFIKIPKELITRPKYESR